MLIVEHKKLPHRWESFYYPNGQYGQTDRLSGFWTQRCEEQIDACQNDGDRPQEL